MPGTGPSVVDRANVAAALSEFIEFLWKLQTHCVGLLGLL